MANWWSDMHAFQQVMFVVACATTLFMIVQIIMLAVGSGDNDSTFDSDTDIDDTDPFNDNGTGFTIFGLRILSVRSIIAFFAIGSWLTFALFYAISWWAIIPGVIAGAAAAFAIAAFMKAVYKMQSNGNINSTNACGKACEVYLTVPASREGNGKINVNLQERFVEMEAVTDSLTPIKTGAKAKIVEVLDGGIAVIEPYAAAIPTVIEDTIEKPEIDKTENNK